MEIGKKYKLTNSPAMADEFRDREFTVTKIDRERVYIHIKDDNEIRNFKIEKWPDFVQITEPWEGNKLLFKFI